MKDLEAAPTVTTYDGHSSPKDSGSVNTEPRETRRVSLLLLLVASMPRMAIQMAWAAQWAALGPFLGRMLPRSTVQFTQIAGMVSGILVGPIIGAMSDRSTNKWGRRRPFLVWAGVLTIVCWIPMAFIREMGEALGDTGDGWPGTRSSHTYTAILAACFFFWMDVTVYILHATSVLLVADVAGDRQVTGAVLGWQSALVGVHRTLGAGPPLSLRVLGYASGVLAVSLVVLCVAVKETPRVSAADTPTTSALARIGASCSSIFSNLRALPLTLAVFGVATLFAAVGFVMYAGNIALFFGFFVYKDEPDDISKCFPNCPQSLDNYARGEDIANVLSYVSSALGCTLLLVLPLVVKRVGIKWVVAVVLVPQACLIAMAFSKIVAVNAVIVVLVALSHDILSTLVVPLCVHVLGDQNAIGVYVGVLNSVTSVGSLITFAVGAAMVNTSLQFQLPVLMGGILGLVGLVVCAVFFHVKMYSL